MIVGYISMLTFQLRTIAGASIDIQRQVVYLKILLEYDSMHPEGVIPDTVSSRSTERIFDVRNLGAFADGRLLFNNVSFRIHEGEMFALSAPSGFGKSTILQYLLGLDTPTEGDIYFRGYRINTELSASILEDVAVVPQKAVLVQGTIRDNILYGTDDILPDDELFCILNSLGLIKEDCGEHFLAFLDRDINPLGSGLSGGEIQRLCIARALARKKKIIVLDEPTASIGEELAIKIITYIRQHCPTVIITTHNPRILELADHFLMVCQSLASLLEKAETNKPHTLIHLYLIPRFASRGEVRLCAQGYHFKRKNRGGKPAPSGDEGKSLQKLVVRAHFLQKSHLA